MGRKNHIKNNKQQLRSTIKLTNEQKDLQLLINELLKLTTTTPQQNVNKEFELQKEIYNVLEKIKTHESGIELNVPNDLRYKPETIDKFVMWLKENNATFEGTKIEQFPGFDLGLKASMDIPEASLIIGVPRKLMMTVESAKRTCMGSLIKNDILLSKMPNVALAMFLLLEKFKETSFWTPYLHVLPTTYSTVLYFSLDELKELIGSPTFRSALLQNKNIARQYAYFHKLIWSTDNQFCEILKKHFTFNSYW